MRLALALLILGCVACRPSSPSVSEPAVNEPAATPAEPRATAATAATPAEPAPAESSPPAELVWLDDEAAARAAAAESGKPLLVDFAADWCAPCKQLETVTFADPAVRARLADFVLLRLDVTEQSDADAALQERYGATALPAIRVRAPDGTELLRISEFVSPAALLEALASIE